MRSCAAVTLVLMLLLFGIPWLAEAPEGGQAPSEPLAAEEQRADADIALTVWDGQELRQMTMAEYLPGVVRGEMPAAFSQQALDAQAVAERTFICYHMAGGRKDAHPEADVCTSPACCSAYVSQEDAAARWGDKAEEYETKVQQAVRDTDGQIILYDGSPILAAFHSSSAGVTADSGDVWSSSLPYPQLLQRQHLLPGGVPGDLSGGPWGCRPLRRPGGVVPGSDGQRLRPGGAYDHRRRQREGDGGAAAVLPALSVLHRGYG